MTSGWVFEEAAIVFVSILAGIIFFYISSPSVKHEKKQQLEEGTSLIINFVLFIWAGKIVLNIHIFVTDPLAVLAYPSDAHAFYMAVLLLLVNIVYKATRKQMYVGTVLSALVPIFLGSAFLYEFIEAVWNDNTMSWSHMGLLFILLILFLIRYEQIRPFTMTALIFTIWSLGQTILTFILPYTTLYGYMMSLWFLILVFTISLIALIYNKRKVT
ncbi:hypothetical protein GCM10007063_15210 [Lentibacillus kapialis]|uniref:Uncharacterized protein n=1 Tax=Lentibacillus kapialis TaxID=340214 RepID=A0A917UX35_9BACI|nr:hypothetical protein [Lentibacillus kapialis]GGJ93609.1 hypothetical protein GCM10007063_15210 [Lentibacillus kapialis]